MGSRLPETARGCIPERILFGGGVGVEIGQRLRQDLPRELVAANHNFLRDLERDRYAVLTRITDLASFCLTVEGQTAPARCFEHAVEVRRALRQQLVLPMIPELIKSLDKEAHEAHVALRTFTMDHRCAVRAAAASKELYEAARVADVVARRLAQESAR